MHITPTNNLFRNTTNNIVRQLGVVGSDGQNVETLEQLQITSSQSTGQTAYDLDRTLKLVRAQGSSEVSKSKARNRRLLAAGSAALGLGMICSGNVLVGLGGLALTLGAFVPLALGTGCEKSALRVLTTERETSYNDGVLTKDEFFYSPRGVDGYKEEAFQCSLGYARKINENSGWLLAK